MTEVHTDSATGEINALTGVLAPGAEFKGTRKLNWLAGKATTITLRCYYSMDTLVTR